MYLHYAAHCDGPFPSRLHVDHQPVMRSSPKVSESRAARLASSQAPLLSVISRPSLAQLCLQRLGLRPRRTRKRRGMDGIVRTHRTVGPLGEAHAWFGLDDAFALALRRHECDR